MPVYLLHSTVPLYRANGSTVQHYLGYCDPGGLPNRLHQHRTGKHSARILLAMRARGATFLLGEYWPERGRDQERQMKRNGHLSAFCLVCQLNRVFARYDALLSQEMGSSVMSPRLSLPHANDFPPPSTPAAPAETGGLSPQHTPRPSTGYRARPSRYRVIPRGTAGTSATARPAIRAIRPAGTKRSSTW